MRNDKYWANRMRILEESLLDTGYDYVKNLERQYATAIQDIESQIAKWYQRFATENGITLAEANKLLTTQELDEFRWTVEEYIKYGQENAVSQAWYKQLKNASARVHVSRLDSLKLQLQAQAEALHGAQTELLETSLAEVYERGYYHTAFELQKGIGVGWTLHGLTDDTIKKVLARPWTLDAQTFSDRIWANKQALVNSVNTQLTQTIMRGAAPDKAIKAIADRFKVSRSQAGRLVMTETAAFANMARKDCFTDLGVKKYVIVETLDKETCSLCGSLDGKVYPMSEYKVGVTTGDVEALKTQIATLQTENATAAKAHEAEIKSLKIDTAVELALSAAKAKNVKAVKALLDLDKAELDADGTVKGLADQIKKLAEAPDSGFMFETGKAGFKGFKPGESGDPNNQPPDYSKMTYDELAAYMENNPDAAN